MKNKKLLYTLFFIVLLATYLSFAWDAAGVTSPVYYNMIMGAIFTFFAFLHGNTYVGKRAIIVLAALTFVVSFIMEYAGVKTGLIFGEYHYGDVLGPKALDTVPWLIPLSWFMFMYVSTISVDAAFGRSYTGWAAPLLFAMLDSIAMTALDILIDPIWVTRGTWVWTAVQNLPAGSVFYGIPAQNYFGWLLTTMMIFIPYRIVFFRGRSILAKRDRDFFLPCLIYASIVAVGCIESFVILSSNGVMLVALMTGGALSIASLLGFMTWREQIMQNT